MSAKKNEPPFALVPFMPTEKMIDAGENAMTCIPPHARQEVIDIFCSMLAAWDIESAEAEKNDSETVQ